VDKDIPTQKKGLKPREKKSVTGWKRGGGDLGSGIEKYSVVQKKREKKGPINPVRGKKEKRKVLDDG